MAGNNKLLALLYGLVGILYIIHGGVDLPGTFDDWLYKNHNFILVLLATLYGSICLVYFYADSQKDHEENNKHNQVVKKDNVFDRIFSVNTIVFLIFLIIIIFAWTVSLRKIFNPSNSNNRIFSKVF